MVMMKRLFIAALMMLAVASCEKEKAADALDITGDWNITEISTKAAEIGGVTVDVWISFRKDNTFAMYQKLGPGRYNSYAGTWNLAGTKLTGSYSDKKGWATEYDVTLEDNGNTLVLTSITGETDTYTKGTVPPEVLNNINR